MQALYKVLGLAIKDKKQDLSLYHLLVSSKIDHKLITLCINMNIKYIISRTAPTALAVDLAKENHIKLMGFARGQRFNLYT